MPDAIKLNEQPRVNVRCGFIRSWRCCPWDPATQTQNDDCKANNIAYDNIIFQIFLEQQMATERASWYYAKYDTYYVDVYINEANLNTEWKVHTHTIKPSQWKPFAKDGYPARGKRTAQIECRNVLNGKTKCGNQPQPWGPGLPGDTDGEARYWVALRVRAHRDLTTHPHPLHDGTADFVVGWEGNPWEFAGENCDWTWCPYEMMWQDNETKAGRPISEAAKRNEVFCRGGIGWFSVLIPPGCSVGKGVQGQFGGGPVVGRFGCGPKVDGQFLPLGPPRAGARPVLEDDWELPGDPFSGIWTNSLGTHNGTGPPDSVMNAVVTAGNDPLIPWKDAVKEGVYAGKDLNFWNGITYPWGFLNGILIGGEFYPSGETGNPVGCVSCTGTGNPTWGPPLPLPTGTGCGNCTFYWDTGVAAWIESYYSAACSGANCQCPPPPWDAGSVHGETKSTGCDAIG